MTVNKRYISKEQIQQALPKASTQFLLGKVFQNITQKLNSGTNYEKILDFIFDSLDFIIPFDRIGIALIEEDGSDSQICLKWVRSKIPYSHLVENYCAPLAGSSLQRIFESGEPRIINDLQKYAIEHPESKSTELTLKDGIRSSMTCPLRSNNKNFGLVFFSSRNVGVYEDQVTQVFLDIADELSMLIEYGRLKKFFENNMSTSKDLRMVLHDLRSPLSVIQGYLELANSEDWYQHLRSEEKNIFSVVERNTKYMFELLEDLSELKKLDFGDEKIKSEEVSLTKFFSDLESNARMMAEKKNIKLKINFELADCQVARFDQIKIHRVLDNLLTNAFKFSNPYTEVTVVIKSDENRLVFEVCDQGQGIPSNEFSKLFTEFGKTSVRPTSGENSTGLGLAIVKKIIEQHGGSISVKSTVGTGSTFSFWLPALG